MKRLVSGEVHRKTNQRIGLEKTWGSPVTRTIPTQREGQSIERGELCREAPGQQIGRAGVLAAREVFVEPVLVGIGYRTPRRNSIAELAAIGRLPLEIGVISARYIHKAARPCVRLPGYHVDHAGDGI